MLAEFPYRAEGPAAMTARFTVPAGCGYQWLSVSVRGGLDEATMNAPWIAALSLRRI
jgi:hypothetical protein